MTSEIRVIELRPQRKVHDLANLEMPDHGVELFYDDLWLQTKNLLTSDLDVKALTSRNGPRERGEGFFAMKCMKS